MIRNIQAVEQPLDFEKIMPFCSCASDADGILQLNNGKMIVLEIKKETPSHLDSKIKHSAQFQLLRKFLGYRSDTIFIYATHTQEIDLNTPIDLGLCTVRMISCGDIEFEVTDPVRNLADCVKFYSRISYDALDLYLMVKYPNGKLEYCVVNPKDRRWSTSYYDFNLHRFTTYKEVENYVEARFIQGYNKKNEYWLFKKEKGSDFMINQYKYNKVEN